MASKDIHINTKGNSDRHPSISKAILALAIASGVGSVIDELHEIDFGSPVTGLCKLSYATVKSVAVCGFVNIVGNMVVTAYDNVMNSEKKEEANTTEE